MSVLANKCYVCFVQGDSIKYFLDSVERIGQMVRVSFNFLLTVYTHMQFYGLAVSEKFMSPACALTSDFYQICILLQHLFYLFHLHLRYLLNHTISFRIWRLLHQLNSDNVSEF